jgi:hypothetical protein
MGLWSVVTAALPIPVTSFNLIPTYKAYTPILATYTSLFCFLLLGYVFYIRHRLASLYFGEKPTFAPKRTMELLPAALILLSLICVFLYHGSLKDSLQILDNNASSPSSNLLNTADYRNIPRANELMILYLGIFLSAELAFIIMATREYLQDAIPIREKVLFGDVGSVPEPEPDPCLVFFKSIPSACRVEVDGQYVGNTPCSKGIPIGVHDLRITEWGYQAYQAPLEIDAGKTNITLEIALSRP